MSGRPALVGIAVLALAHAAACGRYGFDDLEDGAAPRIPESCTDIPGVLVCSSFEEDFDDWQLEVQGSGSLSPDCPTPRSGSQCLVAHIDEGGAAARAWQPFAPQDIGAQVYMRMYARLDSASDIAGVNLATLDAANSGVFGPDLNVVDGGLFELYMDELQANFGLVGPVPFDDWFCLHLSIAVEESNGTVVAGFDTTRMERSGIDTFPNGAYDYTALGVDWSSDEQSAITVLIDDVVVATSPVPCSSP